MPLEEFAALHAGRFDVALSVYVVEHVTDAAAFAMANAQVLRPGGDWFGLTLNVHHYFGATTWAMSRIGASDWLLQRLVGDELLHQHHFPPAYRLNSVRRAAPHVRGGGVRAARGALLRRHRALPVVPPTRAALVRADLHAARVRRGPSGPDGTPELPGNLAVWTGLTAWLMPLALWL